MKDPFVRIYFFRPGTPIVSEGQLVFTNSEGKFISPDKYVDNEGVWKIANRGDGFGPGIRLGTYDALLQRIKN